MKKNDQIILNEIEKIFKKMPRPINNHFIKFPVRDIAFVGRLQLILYHPDLHQ